MGQKGSKSKGTKPKSPASTGASPLNNATYWEAEEDPDWDNCVMVVATQKGRRHPTLRSTCSTDSLARSLHKEVDYSPVNVSRRSPDQQHMSPALSLAPDSRYPTPSQRKRQNTLLDTGWPACFKNNNYVFVRNTDGSFPDAERQFGEKWKENNDSDVTFIISTSKPIREDREEKLVVSLHDQKPNIRRRTLSPPTKEDASTAKTPGSKDQSSAGTRNKRAENKKPSSWLKRLRYSGRNRSIKVESTGEETSLILGANSGESPESLGINSPVSEITASEFPPAGKKSSERVSSPPFRKGQTMEPFLSPSKDETPILQSNYDLTTRGPQTSTPKENAESERLSKNVPRRSVTPYRPLDARLSVRRRLPYENMTPEREETINASVAPPPRQSPQHTLLETFGEEQGASTKLDMTLSPIKKVNDCQHSSEKLSCSDERKSSNRLQRRTSCFHSGDIYKNEEEKPPGTLQRRSSCISSGKAKDILKNKVLQNTAEKSAHSENSSVEIAKSENRLHPSSSNTDIPYVDSEADVSFDDRRGRRIIKERKAQVKSCKSTNDISFQTEDISEQKTRSVHFKPGNSIITPEIKTLSSSEPTIKIDESNQVKETPPSPMEDDENTSLDQHAKHLLSPDDSTVTFSPYSPLKRRSVESPISCWLKEIRLITESECLNALQAKELLKEDWIPNALAVGNAQETSEKIWEVGSAIQTHVDEMLESLKSGKSTPVPLSLKVAQFCSSVIDLLKMNSAIKQVSQAEAKIRKACAELLDHVNKGENGTDWKNKIQSDLENLQKVAQIMVQQLLLKELHVIVDCVDRAANINNLKRSVFAVILLGRMNPTFCELMTKLGIVRSLLSICVEKKWQEMHPCVLRALTVLSCVPSAIRSLEESGGVDCVCDVLCDESAPEGARSEAAGLVAQITAPWTEGSGYVLRSVTNNSDRLVRSIASLASTTDNNEVFLLSSAALANLSFADDALKKMKENKVLEILVTACRSKSHAASLFIKDQVATVLANMAAKEEYRDNLSSGGSLYLLLSFLQLRPSSGHGAPQLAACERVQQKAAIALARLCSNPNTSNIVAEMQGIQRLVKLCKDRTERNDSDSVLVACLAALRKIAAVRQKEEFAKLGAQELVEPRLWDAFLAHSSKRESYV